jgi:hypothetical protein
MTTVIIWSGATASRKKSRTSITPTVAGMQATQGRKADVSNSTDDGSQGQKQQRVTNNN